MSLTTPKYGVPYSQGSDAAATIDNTMAAMAARLDLLIGESLDVSITPSAVDTTTTQRVNYSRSYAALAPLVPKPIVHVNETVGTTAAVNVWTTAEDATGFTLAIRSTSTAARTVRVVVRP